MNPFVMLLAVLGGGLGLAGLGGGRSSGDDVASSDGMGGPTVVDPPIVDPGSVDPDPDPLPDPADISDPVAPTQPGGSGGDGGASDPVPVSDGTIEVLGGRVATLTAAGDDITGVRIVSGVEEGSVTVNPDNSMALVMTLSDFIGQQSFTYEAVHADGSTSLHEVGLNVVPGPHAGGWGTGATHYMLETDDADRVVVEHGDQHAKVYISGSQDALTLADVAAIEGLDVADITGAWLAENGEYGQSEDLALAKDAGMALWSTLTPSYSESSNWLLFEKGYEYSDLGRLLDRGANGESELHPLYIGAWGNGDDPRINSELFQYQESSYNVVIQGVELTDRVVWLDGGNVIFDDVTFVGQEVAIQNAEGVTIRGSSMLDAFRDEPVNGGDWDPHINRMSGFFAYGIDGLLFEGNLVDHAGWEDGYDPNGSGLAGQPPSQYSHNLYLSTEISDLTLRDTISMRAASYGAQVRSGGFIEDNVFLDNNVGFFTAGAGDEGPLQGQYTLATDNLVTSAGHRDAPQIGALAWGVQDLAELTSMVDNIITHLADPNNPAELDTKMITGDGYVAGNAYYDDTIVHNWVATKVWPNNVTELNTEGLDTAVLDQTTIQIFTAQLLSKPDATIGDLADYLRAQADGAFDDLVDADLIIRFFQEGFGIAPDIRDTADTLRFIPSDLADGVRWDNRLNWSTEDLPGTQDGDSVDLGGNHVIYGGNTDIDHLDLGDGGQLEVHNGKLTVDGGIAAGDTSGGVLTDGSGQLWVAGSDGAGSLDVEVAGGRFANTGTMDDASVSVTGGQAILATSGAEFDLAAGETLSIDGSDADVGFDGSDGGIAILDLQAGSMLAFSADTDGITAIEEFRSGAFGEVSNVQSGVDLGGAGLDIDLSDLGAGSSFTLIDADELIGEFAGLSMTGLVNQDANVVVDYTNDIVTLELSAGSGLMTMETIGDEADADAALWAALTADQPVLNDTSGAPVDDPLLPETL